MVIFIGLPVLIMRIYDRRRNARQRRDHPPASQEAEREDFEQRILKPDWSRVEHQLRRRVPEALRAMYADSALITLRDLSYSEEHVISAFEPLDEQAITETASWLGFGAVAIARTDFGDLIYLRPGVAEVDAVYLTHHDGSDTEIFAESVAQMLTVLRTAKPSA
jgi:hypothetical protein